jgi:hypothetical protein
MVGESSEFFVSCRSGAIEKSPCLLPLETSEDSFENPRLFRSMRGQGGIAPLWGVAALPHKREPLHNSSSQMAVGRVRKQERR